MRRREFTPPHRPLVRVRKQCMDAMLLDLPKERERGRGKLPTYWPFGQMAGKHQRWCQEKHKLYINPAWGGSSLQQELRTRHSCCPATNSVTNRVTNSVQTQQCHTKMNAAGCHDGLTQPRVWFPSLAFSCGFRPIFNCFSSSGKTSMWATGLCSVNYQVLREYKYYHCYLFHPLVFCLPFLIGLGWRKSKRCYQLYTSWAKRQCNVTFNTVYHRPPPSSEN